LVYETYEVLEISISPEQSVVADVLVQRPTCLCESGKVLWTDLDEDIVKKLVGEIQEGGHGCTREMLTELSW